MRTRSELDAAAPCGDAAAQARLPGSDDQKTIVLPEDVHGNGRFRRGPFLILSLTE